MRRRPAGGSGTATGRATGPGPRARAIARGLAVGLIAAALFPAVHAGPGGGASRPYAEPERPDDPPAATVPRDNPLARSAGRRIVFGPWVSVQVNVDARGANVVGDAANEPSIAVSPADPSHIVIGWRQFDSVASNFRQAGWAYSTDGGESWTFPGSIEPGVFRSDPVLGADASGAFYYQSLGTAGGITNEVFTSLDAGAGWLAAVPAFGGDKNWMAVDPSGGPSDVHVYGIWQRFAGCCGQQTLTRSTDGAQSFEPPVAVEKRPTFGTLAVGPAGELYAAGIDGTFTQDASTHVVARVADAADPASARASSGVEVDLGGSMAFSTGPNPGGLLGQVNVAVDRHSPTFGGAVYVVASVRPDETGQGPDPLDVHFARSTDGGETWSEPVRVNDDPPDPRAWQWFAAHDVAPNRRIDVIWADTRGTLTDNRSQLFYSYSWDAGQSWSPDVAVSPPFDSWAGWPNQNKIGDYYTIVSDETGAGVAWSATFNGEQDVYFTRVFPDCNGNGTSDVTDVRSGSSADCNSNDVPDACEPPASCLAAGSVPDGARVPGPPLMLGKAVGGEVELSWSASCLAGDVDYGIYEGTLGAFDAHAPRACSTGGATSASLAPLAGDAYYLVVPQSASFAAREGSYGTTGTGIERPPAAEPCLPQEVASCVVF